MSELLCALHRQPSICYLSVVLLGALLIRAILCIFKVATLRQGEGRDSSSGGENDLWVQKPRREVFARSFCSCGHDPRVDDYLLPALIGVVELYAYPILMKCGLMGPIAFWIGIKTAGRWGITGNPRTAFNRFLFGNLLALGYSALLLTKLLS